MADIVDEHENCVIDSQRYTNFRAAVTHITRGLRHLDLGEAYFKEKTADKTCIIVKVASEDNNADIGTKRIPLPLFNKLTYRLVDKSLRKNL